MPAPTDGGRPASNANQPADRQMLEVGHLLQHLGQMALGACKFTSNPLGTAALELSSLAHETPHHVGRVVQAIPYLNWYKVQLDRGSTAIGCCCLSSGGFMPIGARETGMIHNGSTVLVYQIPGADYGVILGAIPEEHLDVGFYMPGWSSQGSGAGFHQEPAHNQLLQLCQREGGVHNFACGRPLDGTNLDRGAVTETGIGFHIDPFLGHFSLDEVCGFWLSIWDHYARLAGWNFDLLTSAYEETTRNDEGELFNFRGDAVYPWEALGVISPGAPVMTDQDPQDVFYQKHVGALELPDDARDTQPIYRRKLFGGYLGQGGLRQVIVPFPITQELNQYKDDPQEVGVLEETIGLDGSYGLRSAHSLIFSKDVLIPVPKQHKLSEDGTGDSKTAGKYLFSGMPGWGGGNPPKISDVTLPADSPEMAGPAAVDQLLENKFNWKAQHPFFYHEKDFETPDEGTVGPFTKRIAPDFSSLVNSPTLPAPQPVSLPIDQRQKDVHYFPNRSYLAFLPEGGLAFGDGYGAELIMSGGKVRITCPGDVELVPGRDLVAWGGNDCVVRARNSVDITAGENDVRIKAEKNMQLLAGNSGQGGLLLESKSQGANFSFDNKVGEDVVSSGIMLRALGAPILSWAQQVYLRTGGNGVNQGNIVLDAAQGQQDIIDFCSSRVIYAASQLDLYITNGGGEHSTVTAAYGFDDQSAFFPSPLIVNGGLTLTKGGIVAAGDCTLTGSGQFSTEVEQQGIGKLTALEAATLNAELTLTQSQLQTFLQQASTDFNLDLAQAIYGSGQVGDDQVVKQAGFSYRDAQDDSQYGTSKWQFLEPRWQQLARLGSAQVGDPWDEKPVSYQGQSLYPYPGKNQMTVNKSFYQLKDQDLLFDVSTGLSVPRTEAAFGNPSVAWDPQILNQALRTQF